MKTKRSLYVGLVLSVALAFPAANAVSQVSVQDNCEAFKTQVDLDQTLENDEKTRQRILSSSDLSHTFIWENDSFAGGGDFNYTNGMKLAWLHNPCRHRLAMFKGAYRNALGVFFSGELQVHSGGLVGMNMYTPNELRIASRITTDRPYAGYVYGGWSFQASRVQTPRDQKKEDHLLEVTFGFTGPVTAQHEIQEYIHRNITNSQIAQGWDNQIDTRLGVNALYAYRRDFEWERLLLRAVPHAGFNLGNLLQFVNAGGMIMFGDSAGDYPGTTIMPVRIAAADVLQRTANDATEKKVQIRPRSVLYGFAGIDYRYIANSVFVEGFGDSKHDIDLMHGVYDLIAGFAVGTRNYRFSYKLIWRSKEFHSSDSGAERTHRLGQFSFSWFF